MASTAVGAVMGGIGGVGILRRAGRVGNAVMNTRPVRAYHKASSYNLSSGFDRAARSAGRGQVYRKYWGLHMHAASVGTGRVIGG